MATHVPSYGAIICGLWIVVPVYWVTAIATGRSISATASRYWRVGIPAGLSLALLFLLARLLSVEGMAKNLFLASVTPARGVVAVVLTMAGLSLATWARAHLGRSWGIPMTAPPGSELVTSGPYKLVRHPIYAGLVLGMVGSALVFNTFGSFLSFVMGIYFVFSAFAEEKILTLRFPDQYPEYRKRSKMLLPFVV